MKKFLLWIIVLLCMTPQAQAQSDFRWEQNGCNTQHPYLVHFSHEPVMVTQNQTYTEYWSFGDGQINDGNYSSTNTKEHDYTQPGTYFFCYRLMGHSIQNPAVASVVLEHCDTVTVLPCVPPTCDFTINHSSCDDINPNTYHFRGTASPNQTVNWSFGDGSTVIGSSDISHRYNTPGTYVVCMGIYNPIGNSVSEYVCNKCDTITVLPCDPLMCYIKMGIIGCDELTGLVTYAFNSDAPAGTEVDWSFGDGNTGMGALTNHSFAQGIHTVCMKLKTADNNGNYTIICEKCAQISIEPCEQVRCDFDIEHTTCDSPNPNTYYFNTTNNPNHSVIWNLGDGNGAVGANVDHHYTPGTYNVCMNVSALRSDYYEFLCEKCDTITVLPCPPPPSCDFTIDHTSCDNNNPNTYYFNSTGTSSQLVSWNFGDGSTGTGANVNHQYTPGTYNVCMNVSALRSDYYEFLCEKCDTITVLPCDNYNCDIMIAKSRCDTATGLTTYFFDVNAPVGAVVDWNFGDATYGMGENTTHAFAPGAYTVCVRVKILNPNGVYTVICEKCVNIRIDPCLTTPAPCDFTINNNPCNSTDPNIYHFSSNYVNVANEIVHWTFGDGSMANGNGVNHYYAPGTYYVCMTVYNIEPNDERTFVCEKCDSITVQQCPPTNCNAEFTPFQNLLNNDVWFQNNSTGSALNYYWNFGDGSTSTDENPVHHYTTPGTYYVCLKVVNPITLCCDSTCHNITICGTTPIPTCNPAFEVLPYMPCPPQIFDPSNPVMYPCDPVMLPIGEFYFQNNSTPAAGATYTWNFGDGTTSNEANPVHNYTNTGVYNVCLVVQIGNQTCEICHTVTVQLPQQDTCNAAFEILPYIPCPPVIFDPNDPIMHPCDPAMLPIGEFYFQNNSAPAAGATYNWDFGDGTTSNEANPVHHYYNSGIYTVCLTVYTGNQSCLTCHTVTIPEQMGCNAAFEWAILDPCINFPAGMSCTLPVNLWHIQFHNNSSPQVFNTQYTWDFGDGSILNDPQPNHLYNAPGLYEVCFTVVHEQCTSKVCHMVQVGEVVTCDSIVFMKNMIQNNPHYWHFQATNPNHVYTWSVDNVTVGLGHDINRQIGNGTHVICAYASNDFDMFCNPEYCVTITNDSLVAGMSSVNTTGEINLYPNPSNNGIYIDYTNVGAPSMYKIDILNSIGQVVSSKNIQLANGKNTIYMQNSELAVGVYSVHILTNNTLVGNKMFIKSE